MPVIPARGGIEAPGGRPMRRNASITTRRGSYLSSPGFFPALLICMIAMDQAEFLSRIAGLILFWDRPRFEGARPVLLLMLLGMVRVSFVMTRDNDPARGELNVSRRDNDESRRSSLTAAAAPRFLIFSKQ